MKYICKYEYRRQHGSANHLWSLVGEKGGVHLSIHAHDNGKYYGGIETHFRVPPKYLADQPPTHEDCWLLHSVCWHDGSSNQAEEKWIPLWKAFGCDHDTMFEELAKYADDVLAVNNE